MPVLKISDGEGHLAPDAGSEVLAAMIAPSDEDFRVRHRVVADCAALFEDAMEQGKESLPIPTTTFGLILTSPPLEELQLESLTRFSYGELAGWVLGLVVHCADQYPEHASVSKAVEALETVVLPDGRMSDGRPIPRSRGFLMKQWSAFKSVAHFYAAHEALHWGKKHPAEVFLDASLLMMVAVAEHYRRIGESLVVKHGRSEQTLLTPGEAWTAPSDLPLPEIRLEDTKIPEEVVEAMEKYRAPKRF